MTDSLITFFYPRKKPPTPLREGVGLWGSEASLVGGEHVVDKHGEMFARECSALPPLRVVDPAVLAVIRRHVGRRWGGGVGKRQRCARGGR